MQNFPVRFTRASRSSPFFGFLGFFPASAPALPSSPPSPLSSAAVSSSRSCGVTSSIRSTRKYEWDARHVSGTNFMTEMKRARLLISIFGYLPCATPER